MAWKDGWCIIIIIIIICWWWFIAWYVSCLGCYCTHVLWHNGTLKDCLIDVELSTSMFLFLQGHLVRFPHELAGESYTYRAGPLENIHCASEGWSCSAGTEYCLVLRDSTQRLWNGSTLRCLVFQRVGESQTLYSKSMKWRCVCVCVSLIWTLSLETLSPIPQHKDVDMHFSVFTTSAVWEWNFFLPWNVKSYFSFCVH